MKRRFFALSLALALQWDIMLTIFICESGDLHYTCQNNNILWATLEVYFDLMYTRVGHRSTIGRNEFDWTPLCYSRDAAALAEFWAWLENTIVNEKQTLSEVEVCDRLEEFRAKQAGFLDTSFETISGTCSHQKQCFFFSFYLVRRTLHPSVSATSQLQLG